MDLHIDRDLAAIPFLTERDEETGGVIAYNDELNVVAFGRDEAEAASQFRETVTALAEAEVSAGRTLPIALRPRVPA